MPEIAAAASWMESLKLSSREIKQRYTRSQLVIMAWRSNEMSANMNKTRVKFKLPGKDSPAVGDYTKPSSIKETDEAYVLPEGFNGDIAIPKKFFDKEGELNLSKVTGPEALRYLNALGLNIGGRV